MKPQVPKFSDKEMKHKFPSKNKATFKLEIIGSVCYQSTATDM